MPESNGLKQVLDGSDDDVSPPVIGDDVAVSDDVAGSVDEQEQEFEEPSSVQVGDFENSERVDLSDSVSIENSPSDERLTEDGGKEEMFVDCPDELILSDNKDAVTIEETEQSSEDNDDIKEARVYELVNGIRNDVVMHSPKEFKDDNESLRKEFSNLHHHLKALSHQQPLNNEFEEHAEIGKSLSIHDMANECSKFVKNALDERSRMEDEFKKLQASVMGKDQEIELLHANVSELSVSQNVVLSFLGSQNQSVSDKSNPSIEVEYGLQSINDSINRLLASLGTAINAEGLSDESITGRMLFVEQNVSQLIGNYQYLLSEIELLRQSLTEVSSDFNIQEDFWTTTSVARNVLLEFKRKEVDFGQHVSNLEGEYKKVNADVEKLRVELEQEKNRYANTKEKLSMAVTKGKALVQQRDSLKQSMAEKTSLIEKCLAEIEEKSRALEAADLVKEELLRTENLAASLQETISQKNYLLSKCEEILYQNSVNHELESTDIMERIRCLVDEKNNMAGLMLDFNKLGDVVSSVEFPENVSSSDIRSRVSWLVESFLLAKDEVGKLKDEIARSSEVARDEIERLTVSLLTETQEKNVIQEELEGLTHKYQVIVDKESQLLMEKDRIVSLLLEASGTTIDVQEEAGFDMGSLIDRCFGKIKERSSTLFDADLFEHMQSQLYITNQELVICEELLEEDMQIKAKMDNLVVELGTVSQELQVLKDEKSALQRDLVRSDEKTASLRDKLSMAVKKGKGLVQDKENLKKLMDEKTAEIKKLNLALQQQESVVDDFRDQISKLSRDVELIPKLEDDLAIMKDQKDQLQQFLVESNNMVQTVMEPIDEVVLPAGVTFEQPIDKVLWLVKYLNECQDAKTLVEQELGNVKVDFDSLSSKLSDAYAAKSSLEEALSTAENKISQLGEEKRELSEISATRKSLEDALLEAESKISVLNNEKNDAQLCKAEVETKLEKAKEEVSTQTTRLAEAYRTINSLEDALSQLETNVSLLSKENNDTQVDKSNLEHEMKKLKEKAEFQTSKFLDATSTIRSLEDTLSKLVGEKENAEAEILTLKEEVESQASKFLDITSTVRSMEDNLSKLVGENKNADEEISILKKEAESQDTKLFDAASTIRSLEDSLSTIVGEKKNAEEEISLLNSKLSACMEELAGLGGSLENRSLELSSHLNNLQLLLKDETVSSLIMQSFEVKFQSLRDMDFLLRDIKDHLVQIGSDSLPSSPSLEEDFFDDKFSTGFDNAEIDKGDGNSEGGDSFESYFKRTVEGIQSRNRVLADKVQVFSTSMDKFFVALLKKLQATRDDVVQKIDLVRSLEQKVNDLETGGEAKQLKIASLENDVKVLFSACIVTAQELEMEAENYRGEPSSPLELEKWTNLLSEVRGDTVALHEHMISTHIKPAEDLLMAAQKICALTRLLERERSVSADAKQVLENEVTESKATGESITEERDILQARVFKLETDLKVLQSSYQEMILKLEEFQAKETTLSDQEAEISSLRKSLTMKEKEAEDSLLVASQLNNLYDKINDLEIPFTELNMRATEFHDSDYLKKFFYVVDAAIVMQRQMKTLIEDKEMLQSTVEKQAHQIEHLEGAVEDKGREKGDLEKIKNEIFEVEVGMEKIIHKLGGNHLVENHKSSGVRGLLSVLEKLVTEIFSECDSTKSKAQELGVKLSGSQKVVDELSAKVKLLEASSQFRASSSDGVEETSIFEAPLLPARSEIIELEDVGPLGKIAVGQSSSAPHARSLRKGSNDHLAINIDSESDRLIKNEESDEDKGKLFKSLNTSGLVPRQGKQFADRVDGYWVSGDRALMSRPRARLGLIAYWLLLHIWLLGTIL